jgi:hypothetical protein
VEALESLVTVAIYAELIDGALDPANQIVHIDSITPLRDLQPGNIPKLTQAFDSWSAQCTDTLTDMQKEIDRINDKARAKAQRDKRIHQMFEAKVEAAGEELKQGKRGLDSSKGPENLLDEHGDDMEVDGEGSRSARTKRSVFSGMGRRLGG